MGYNDYLLHVSRIHYADEEQVTGGFKMMWVSGAGKQAIHLESFIKNKRIYLAWDGYDTDLQEI